MLSNYPIPSSSFLMELSYDLQPEETDTILDEDDDVFYAELRRQILLLTAEDEDEDGNFHENKRSNSRRGSVSGGCLAAVLPGSYSGWVENIDENSAVPAWLVNLWRKGNGTGVFIPRIVKTRRRNRPRGKNNNRGRMYKPMANKNE